MTVQYGPGNAMATQAAQVYGARSIGGASWWLAGGIAAADCLGAFAAKGAASLAGSHINLNSPGSGNLIPNGTLTWDAINGWSGFSAIKFLKTAITPANQTFSAIVYGSRSGSSAFRACLGTDDVTNRQVALGPWGGSPIFANGGLLSTGAGWSVGASESFAVAGNIGYRNGAAVAGTIPDYVGGGATTPIYIGGLADASLVAVTNVFEGYIYFVAFYSIALSAPQVAAVHTAMIAL